MLSSSDQFLRDPLRKTGPKKWSSGEGKPCCYSSQRPKRGMVSNHGWAEGLFSFYNPAHNLLIVQNIFPRIMRHMLLYSLQTWEKDMKMAEALPQQHSLMAEENIPPVRGSNCSVPLCKVKKNGLHYTYRYMCLDRREMIHSFMPESSSKEREERVKTSSPTWLSGMGQVSQVCSWVQIRRRWLMYFDLMSFNSIGPD